MQRGGLEEKHLKGLKLKDINLTVKKEALTVKDVASVEVENVVIREG